MRQNLIWTLALGLLGLFLDSFALPVFGEMVFRGGSVAALVVAIALGPWWGTLAAAIVGLGSLASGDPHLALVACFEAWAVGWFVRHRLEPLSADLLFWLLFGAPSIALYGLFVLEQDPTMVWVRVAHQPINGVLCAVLAEILLQVWSRRLPGPRRHIDDGRRPLRRQLVHWLALATMLPILAVGLRTGRDAAENRREDWMRSLGQVSTLVAQRLDAHLLSHRQAVRAAARFAEGDRWGKIDLISAQLEATRGAYPNISTMMAIDADGLILVGAPERHPSGGQWWGRSVGDRDYFHRPMETGEPFISDVFLGRGYASGPIIAISAPVRSSAGRPAGVVEASIDVRIFESLVGRTASLSGSELVVVDRLDRVLFSTDEKRYPLMSDLSDSALRSALSQGLREHFTYRRGEGGEDDGARAAGLPGDRAGGSAIGETMLAARADVGLVGWRIVTQIGESRLTSAATLDYLTSAFGLLGAIFLAALVASGVAALITRPLESLVGMVRNLDADQLPTQLPRVGSTAPMEMAQLVNGFGGMALRLEHSYGRLRQTLDEREALNWELEQVLTDLDGRVQARTGELAEAHRQAEQLQEQYRELIDGIHAIVWEFDLGLGRFTFVSRRIREILGYSPGEWYENPKLWRGMIPDTNRRRLMRALHEAIRRGENHEIEYETVTRSQEQRFIRNVMRVVKDGDGKARMLRGVMVDVTAMRRSQEDQLRRRKLESVGMLAGGIAHDFNNLLTAILGNLSLAELGIEDGDRPVEILGHLREMEKAAEKARLLSQKLLTFSRGGLPIRRAMAVEPLVEELVEQATRGGLDCHRSSMEDLWWVEADRDQLGQVLGELVENAVQAMPEGGRLEITVENEEVGEEVSWATGDSPLKPGSYVLFTVRDHGPGMDEDQLSKVFDPYYSTKEKGRGFGLATAYSIVQHHGGHIEIASRPGYGTGIRVWIPAAAERPVPLARPQVAKSVQPGRILVMDDEESVRLVAGMMLRHLGWQVVLTKDGAEAVEVYSEALGGDEPFDLVITDLTVPGGMGGAEAIERLLRIDPQVQAIVCSGYSNDPVMARYREHGFIGVMAKPFDLQGLRNLLAEVTGATESGVAFETGAGAETRTPADTGAAADSAGR